MRIPKIDFRKSISPLIVNVAIVLMALWLVSCASLPTSELITDSKTSSELQQMEVSSLTVISDSTQVGAARGGNRERREMCFGREIRQLEYILNETWF